MTASPTHRIVADLLQHHGRMFSEELGIRIRHGRPGAVERWLLASMLLGCRVTPERAARAFQALEAAGWSHLGRLQSMSGDERAAVLEQAGITRFDECRGRLIDFDVGPLSGEPGLEALREEAGHDPDLERSLFIDRFGLDDGTVDVFFREVQLVWDELWPFADRQALEAARRLEIGETAEDLCLLVDPDDFVPLVSALIRASIAGSREFGELLKAA